MKKQAVRIESVKTGKGMTFAATYSGARPVPRIVDLACKGWEVEHGQHA